MPIECDPTSAFFGFMGVASSIIFATLGAAYGTGKSAVGMMSSGVLRPDMLMRNIMPVVMAGVLGIWIENIELKIETEAVMITWETKFNN